MPILILTHKISCVWLRKLSLEFPCCMTEFIISVLGNAILAITSGAASNGTHNVPSKVPSCLAQGPSFRENFLAGLPT